MGPLKWIRYSNVMRMFAFMAVSGFILDAVHVMGGHVFWLIYPFRQPKIDDEKTDDPTVDPRICLHKDASCRTYVLQALQTYGSIGLCLEIIKSIIGNIKLVRQQPIVGLVQSLERINPRFLLFVAGYPTLYRVNNNTLP